MPLLPEVDAQASFLNVTMVKRDKTETQKFDDSNYLVAKMEYKWIID